MTLLGKIHQGQIELLEPIELPDGTTVQLQVQAMSSPFWNTASIDELTQQQQVAVTANLDTLRGDWPDTDSIDDFLSSVREVRR